MPEPRVIDELKELGETEEVEIVLLTRKNGDIIASAGEVKGLQLETFGIMSATIYGAGNTANEHLNKKKPERIVMRADDGDTVIQKVDADHMLVLRTHTRDNFAKVLKKADKTVKSILKFWEE